MSETIARRVVRLVNKEGLHARPSQMIVETANRYGARITIRIGEKEADGKSILELMMMASPCGSEIEIAAEGEDAEAAVEALGDLILSGFGEELA